MSYSYSPTSPSPDRGSRDSSSDRTIARDANRSLNSNSLRQIHRLMDKIERLKLQLSLAEDKISELSQQLIDKEEAWKTKLAKEIAENGSKLKLLHELLNSKNGIYSYKSVYTKTNSCIVCNHNSDLFITE